MSVLTIPNVEDFKRWCDEYKPLAEAVCLAEAFAQLERERVDAYIAPIFARYRFPVTERFRDTCGEWVEKPDDLYLCTDEELCKKYYDECDTEHRRHGFTGKPGHCPALEADWLHTQAENALIEAGCKFIGLELHQVGLMEHRKRMLDLLIGACLKSPRNTHLLDKFQKRKTA